MTTPDPGPDLATRTCQPCTAGSAPHDAETARRMLSGLSDWRMSEDARAITRRFEVKGFARAVELANLAAWLGNRQGHHPDIAFGWGYCAVTFTTHAVSGLTDNDFICAARLDALLA